MKPTGKSSGRRKSAVVILFLSITLLLAILLAVAIGAVRIPFVEVVKMTLNQLPFIDIQPTWSTAAESIIFQLRFPRVIGAALVGSALATAGVLFQGLLRNPMADPYIIGTSSGAALGAAIAMMLPLSINFLGFGIIPALAFTGALGAVFLVYTISRTGNRTNIVSLLLAGFVIGSLLTALTTLIITVSDWSGHAGLQTIFSFLMGRISVSNWTQLLVIAPLIIIVTAACRLLAPQLNAFALGEEGAAYLGIATEKMKIITLGTGSLLTAGAVCISGLVGFVGLVVPHGVRLVLGPDHRLLLPASALAGAIFLVLADLLARSVLAPSEIPLGAITAIIGAPLFIFLLRKSKTEYGF